jgi:hypothetical protein
VPIEFSLETVIRKQIPNTFIDMIDELELKSIRRHLIQSKWLEQVELA